VRVLGASFPQSSTVHLIESLVSWLAWGATVLWITGLLPAVLEELEAIHFAFGKSRISLRTLLEGVLSSAAMLVVVLWISATIERRILSEAVGDLSMRKVAANAIRAGLLLVGLLLALSAAGVDLTALSVLGGALGVGLGFGLQKVASNYVSGFIILLDRSVRIGDLITVDNRYGEVEEINTRYTLIRSVDGTESIVPNETLITETVVNHSLSQPAVRVALPVQVSYDADLELAQALMLEAARGHPRVVQDEDEKLPRVFLKDFADNGIMLELGVWIRDPSEGQNNLRSDINWAIWRSFKAAGIQIPFPQRVVHLAAKEPADP
jgi:small-conductance mechanosensitive channel